jgi:hypothetical protein
MAYRGGAVAASSGTTQTVTVSGINIQLNDIVLLCLCCSNSATPTWPAGFTQVTGTSPAVTDGNTNVYTYSKVATASEPSSYSVSGVSFGGALHSVESIRVATQTRLLPPLSRQRTPLPRHFL